MAHPVKSVAVIGAGASGITAIKCCLDEGLEVVCFERSCDVGGLWRFTEAPVEGQGCVMKSTVINTSKEMMSYSDFPIPAHYPIFMHNSKVFEYFQQYVKHFDLHKHIKFNTSVISVRKTDDFATTGQWEVKYRDVGGGEEKTQVFDAILACTGHHADKNVPDFPGLDRFKGKVIHSHDYRTPEQFDGKRVVVIGIGNSGGDISVELSRRASQVYLSTRRGTWILHRVGDNGHPVDMTVSRAIMPLLKFPSLVDRIARSKINSRIDHELYSLKPDFGPFSQHPMVNDDMPNRIISGSLIVKSDIQELTETGVKFVDGTTEDDIDAVVLATGYSFGFPYIDKQVIDVVDNRVHLYKNMFLPDLEKQTLAFIGFIQPLGAIMPISEMQCRVATRVFKGLAALPSNTDIWSDIRLREAAMAKRYYNSRRHTIQVDYASYMDQLAEIIGCKPDLTALLKSDLRLFLKVLFGPVTPYQFRLFGPLTWPGARDTILSQWDRVKAPLSTRKCATTDTARSHDAMKFAVLIIVFFLIRYFIWL